MTSARSKLWRRSGYVLCVLGAALLLAEEILPIDLFFSRDKHVYYRVVPGAGSQWYWLVGGTLLAAGVAAILRSTKLKGGKDGNAT